MPDASLLFVETFRDWVIIFMGIAVAAFFVVAMVITIVLGLLVRSLLKKTSSVLDDYVRPLLDSAKSTTENVRGTANFVSDAAVTPIIRTYGVVAGVRRAKVKLRRQHRLEPRVHRGAERRHHDRQKRSAHNSAQSSSHRHNLQPAPG